MEKLPDEVTPTVEELQSYPFFSRISERVLTKLLPNLSERTYAPGDLILRTGDYSDSAYLILEGTASARLSPVGPPTTRKTPAKPDFEKQLERITAREPLAEAVQLGSKLGHPVLLSDISGEVTTDNSVILTDGEIFGEIGALSRYPVSADVHAVSEVRCLAIRAPALRMMLRQKDLADFKKAIDDRYRERSLRSQLLNVDLFAGLDDELIARLRESAELLWFEPGDTIAEQDTLGDALYLVRGGYVKVAVTTGAADLVVTYLRKGDYAGESSLVLGDPWPFSLRALEHVEMVKIAREDFQAVVAARPEVDTLLRETARKRLEQRRAATRNPLASEYMQMAMDTGLIHGESVLLIDLNACTRCDDCVRGCADTHEGVPRFVREGSRFRQWSVPTACYQCSDPVCMIGCPTGAITRPLGTLEVTIDPTTCIGCSNCVKRCPWDNIVEVPYQSPVLSREIQLATKCDLCMDRAEGPACVQMCPHGAAVRISFKDIENVEGTLSKASTS